MKSKHPCQPTILTKYGFIESASQEREVNASTSVVPVSDVASNVITVTAAETVVQLSMVRSYLKETSHSVFADAIFQAPVTINVNLFEQKKE